MNYKRKGSTIYDIAKAAQVSPTTVSRVLNDTTYPVSEELRHRVLSAAHTLHYTARGKLRPTERDVVVMVPRLSNLFYTTLVSGMEGSLRMFGLNMLLMNTQGDIGLEKQLITELGNRSSVRLIIFPVTDDISHLQPLMDRSTPMVIIELPEAGECSTICVDYGYGARAAVQHMLSRGLRRIAFLGTPLTRYSRTEVYNGYCAALEQAGIPLDKELLFWAESAPIAQDDASPFYLGMHLLDRMLESCSPMPDGIYCSNDMIAIGVLHRLAERNIRVPQDISVAGMDNLTFSAVSYPPLTTVDPCTYEAGRMAAETLYAQLMGSARQHVNIMLEPKLILRDSVR